MSTKFVGITCSTSADPNENPRQYLNSAYVHAVRIAGGVPIVIPNSADPDELEAYLGRIDGLLLSGGVDVGPEYFGEERHSMLGSVDSDRDTTELALLKGAIGRDMPVFGICRGIQVLNVALGGSLYQHIPDQTPSEIHHQQTDIKVARDQFSHSIAVESDSRLSSIVGAGPMETNSFHHQALKTVAPGLVVTARAADGIIEAVEAPDRRYMVAVQFHPEETAPRDDRSRRLFEAFIEAL